MKLTTKGQYALRAALVVTCRQNSEKAITLSSISKQEGISLPYLEQLFQRLRKSGVMRSLRGPGGGYRTARPPSEISVYDVINAVEEDIALPQCAGIEADQSDCSRAAVCGCKDVWDDFMEVVVGFFSSVSLEDLHQKTLQKQILQGVPLKNILRDSR